MRYRDATSFRQALERRLARLAVVVANGWMLKGGFALDLRMTERARATKEIDLDWRDAEEGLLDTLLDAVDHDAGDFFVFRVERASSPRTVSAEAARGPGGSTWDGPQRGH